MYADIHYGNLIQGYLNTLQIKESLEEEIQAYLELNDMGEVEPPMLWDAFGAVMRAILSHVQLALKNDDRKD